MSFESQATLITEHLTFPPLSLVDDIINTVNTLLYKAVNATDNFLQKLPESSISAEEVESGIHKFETLLENAVDRNFDAMELFVLRNIVNIPEDLERWVRLKHHEGLDFSTDDTAEVEEELQKVKKTLAASKKVNAMLKRERQLNQRKLALLEEHAGKLQFLEDIARANDVGSMTDSAGFLKEQIAALHSTLDEVTKLSSVLDLGLEVDDRSKYIEKVLLSTVKHGSYEQEMADANAIGTAEDLHRVATMLKGQNTAT